MERVKEQLYQHCQNYLRSRIHAVQQAIEAAQQSANEETKSSSGDKYETGRAMMQLEIEKNAVQLAECVKLKHALDQIPLDRTSPVVQPGSIVKTDRETFYLAISLGKVTLGDKHYTIIAPGAPLAQKLIGLKPGDKATFRDQNFIIQEIV